MTNLWPLPALLAWGACWAAFAGLRAQGSPATLAFAVGALLGATIAMSGATPWRRIFIGAGFPLSLAASGSAAGVPAWAWLVFLGALLLVYPVGAWRDAPLFPTPRGALRGLAQQLAVPGEGRILDAGCGLGDALVELRREFPRAALSGIERSRPLRIACAWRCRFAAVRRADMWSVDWTPFDLVYVFQRPESMQRAAAKAQRELRDGAWLASLEFEVAAWRPTRVFGCADGRALWLYRAPFTAAAEDATG
jgi:SAM-dependent methyltransferase